MRRGGKVTPTSRDTSRVAAIAVVVAAVAVTILSGYLLASWPPEPPPSGAQPASEADAAGPDERGTATGSASGNETVLFVLGDSFTARGEDTGPTWPTLLSERLGWKTETNAVADTGYVSNGDGDGDGDAQRFAERAKRALEQDADVIVVAGGVEDLGAHPIQQIVDGAQETVTTLSQGVNSDTELVVVSPFSNGSPGPLTREFSDKLQQIAADAGASYVDATQWLVGEGLFAGPETPSSGGQQRIATKMEQALVDLGLAEPADTAASAG